MPTVTAFPMAITFGFIRRAHVGPSPITSAQIAKIPFLYLASITGMKLAPANYHLPPLATMGSDRADDPVSRRSQDRQTGVWRPSFAGTLGA